MVVLAISSPVVGSVWGLIESIGLIGILLKSKLCNAGIRDTCDELPCAEIGSPYQYGVVLRKLS